MANDTNLEQQQEDADLLEKVYEIISSVGPKIGQEIPATASIKMLKLIKNRDAETDRRADKRVAEERARWVKASMQRLAKYDTTGILPETQALIDQRVEEARVDELQAVLRQDPGDFIREWTLDRIAELQATHHPKGGSNAQ